MSSYLYIIDGLSVYLYTVLIHYPVLNAHVPFWCKVCVFMKEEIHLLTSENFINYAVLKLFDEEVSHLGSCGVLLSSYLCFLHM